MRMDHGCGREWRSKLGKYVSEKVARLHAYLLRDVEPQDQDHDTDVSFISKTTLVTLIWGFVV